MKKPVGSDQRCHTIAWARGCDSDRICTMLGAPKPTSEKALLPGMKDAATYASLKKLVEQGHDLIQPFMPWEMMTWVSCLLDSECNLLDDDLFNRRLDPPTFTPALCLGPVPTGLGSFGDSLFDKPAPVVYSNINELNSLRKVCVVSVGGCVESL